MEILDKLLPWMAEHWFLTIVFVWGIARARPLMLVGVTSTAKSKTKTKTAKAED